MNLTLFFLHLHHLPLPLIKSGDVLGVSAAHSGICVCGNRGTQVLSEIMRTWELGQLIWYREEKIVHVVSEILTSSFSMWDVLASRCCEPWLAGELGGGSLWILVPVVWTLEVFSRTTGGLLCGQKQALFPCTPLICLKSDSNHTINQQKKPMNNPIILGICKCLFLSSIINMQDYTHLSLSYGLSSSSQLTGGKSESRISVAATSEASSEKLV